MGTTLAQGYDNNGGMTDRLGEYRRKRDAKKTPEPIPGRHPDETGQNRFVIQQHHARALHWDVRLERDGVLVSFAVPRGLPRDRTKNHLAKHTEDHPLEYLDFHGEIPAGEYGGGQMKIFDRGTYETRKWRDDEIEVVFHGERATGRYIFFQTKGNDWMVRRMDPAEPGWEPMPEEVLPMLATRRAVPAEEDDQWAYEMNWGGLRTIAHIDGGRVRLQGAQDLIAWFPEIRPLGPALAPIEAVLDGELVAFEGLRPETRLDRRPGAKTANVHYLIYDLLWLEGHATTENIGYAQRRELLEGLSIAGDHWQTPPYFPGGAAFALDAARAQGIDGLVAKRLDSPYLPGRRSQLWRLIPPTAGDI
jgi:bifunctional non-homologous end joining protein LigD